MFELNDFTDFEIKLMESSSEDFHYLLYPRKMKFNLEIFLSI
jgi:hypothetical protein